MGIRLCAVLSPNWKAGCFFATAAKIRQHAVFCKGLHFNLSDDENILLSRKHQ